MIKKSNSLSKSFEKRQGRKTIKPDFLEVIEIEVEGEQEEITKLMFHLKSLK